MLETMHELHPALERDLLAKANAAVVKAGKEREIRFGLLRFLKIRDEIGTQAKASQK
jgi:hypothetical protein